MFCALVAVSRDHVGIGKWMPAVWAGEEPEFEDMAEAERIFAAITGRYDQIRDEIDAEAPRCSSWGGALRIQFSPACGAAAFYRGLLLRPSSGFRRF